MRMKLYLSVVLLAAAGGLLSGCTSYFEGGPERAASVTLDKTQSVAARLAAYKAAGGAGNAQTKASVIAEYIYFRLATIDERYNDYRNDLYFGTQGASLGADLAVTGLGLAGALVGGDAAKAAISAASAGITSTKASVRSELFLNSTIAVLIQRMDADRSKIKTTIMQNMASADFGTRVYGSFAAADVDLGSYDEAGHLANALISLSDSASASLSACKKRQTLIAAQSASQSLDSDALRKILSDTPDCN